MLQRIPYAEDFWTFSKAGRTLADIQPRCRVKTPVWGDLVLIQFVPPRYAAELRSEDIDIRIISNKLGHTSIATTARYLDRSAPRGCVRNHRQTGVVSSAPAAGQPMGYAQISAHAGIAQNFSRNSLRVL